MLSSYGRMYTLRLTFPVWKLRHNMSYRVERKHNRFYALILMSGSVICKSSLLPTREAAEAFGRWYVGRHS